jgi:hypothetical protein
VPTFSRLSEPVVAVGGVALAAAGLFFRSGFRSHMIDSERSLLPVHEAWLSLPTLLVLAIVGCVLALDRHPPALEPTR